MAAILPSQLLGHQRNEPLRLFAHLGQEDPIGQRLERMEPVLGRVPRQEQHVHR